MKTIFLVTTTFRHPMVDSVGFENIEEAINFRDYLQSKQRASENEPLISKHFIFEDFEEAKQCFSLSISAFSTCPDMQPYLSYIDKQSMKGSTL